MAKKVEKYKQNLMKLSMLIDEEKYMDALELGKILLQRGCKQPEFLFLIAKCFYFTGDYKRAEEWLQNTLQFSPDHVLAQILLGRLYYMQGKSKAAIKVWQSILEAGSNILSPEIKKELTEVLLLCQLQPLTEMERAQEEAANTQHIEVWSILAGQGARAYLSEKNRLQNITLHRLRHKKKILLSFVLYDSSMWCGDELYHYFAHDLRYEVVVYLCKRHDTSSHDPATIRTFHRQTKEMQARGINVVPILEDADEVDFRQPDILIALTPYDTALPEKLVFAWMSFATLLVYIPYGIFVWDSRDGGKRTYNIPLVNMAWKVFMDTESNLRYYAEHLATGFPNGEVSGSPRCDALYNENCGTSFKWKETMPGSKKIIYAPHWSIDAGCMFSTFQYNHNVMYALARKHKEISWVIKPHPNLIHEAVRSGVFPTEEMALRYFLRWDELPNARFITGGNYQPVMASSDAMILDSASFIVEYQYTGKPLLFLTRPEQAFLPLGLKVLQHNYYVDGRDLYGITAFISQVVEGGQDRKKGQREKFFREKLDYKQLNGMLAGEYIYHSIDSALHVEGGRKS